MRLIRVGPHTFPFDSIEYLFEHNDSASKGGETSLTLFLRGRKNGIELTVKEAEVLTRFLGRECAISDLMASEESGPSLSDPATEIDWYLAVSPLCGYDQEALLRPRLGAIRRHYPVSRIMVQPSEMAPATVDRWREATADLEIDWLASRPIHTAGSGVTPIGAMLEAYLGVPHPAEFLIKIDLDARVRRRFRRLPNGVLGVFGSLEFFTCSGFPFGDFPNVQGGCYGLSRDTARRILNSGILARPELRDNPGIWVDGVADWRYFPEHGRTLEDGLLRWVTKRMGMRPFALGEIDSQFRPHAWDVAGDYAVTHPHKTLDSDETKAGEA